MNTLGAMSSEQASLRAPAPPHSVSVFASSTARRVNLLCEATAVPSGSQQKEHWPGKAASPGHPKALRGDGGSKRYGEEGCAPRHASTSASAVQGLGMFRVYVPSVYKKMEFQ